MSCGSSVYENPPVYSLKRTLHHCMQILTKNDKQMFESIVGQSLESTLARIKVSTLLTSQKKMTAHDENTMGLQLIRHMISYRHTLHRTRNTNDKDLHELTTKGLLVKPLHTLNFSYVYSTLQKVTGFSPYANGISKWKNIMPDPYDNQHYLHIDSVLSTYKTFILGPTSITQSPFNFVLGSHIPSLKKLRWLYNHTRYLTKFPVGGTRKSGPFSTQHKWDKSLRFFGFDPYDRLASKTVLGHFGFELPQPQITTAPYTFIVANTAGFHHRGTGSSPRSVKTLMFNKFGCDGVERFSEWKNA